MFCGIACEHNIKCQIIVSTQATWKNKSKQNKINSEYVQGGNCKEEIKEEKGVDLDIVQRCKEDSIKNGTITRTIDPVYYIRLDLNVKKGKHCIVSRNHHCKE